MVGLELDATFSAQPLVVGAVLVLAGGFKVLSRIAGSGRTAPGRRIVIVVGVVELVCGAALLLPPLWLAETIAAITLTAGSLVYLGYSTTSSAICPRAFARAGVLLLASVAMLRATAPAAPAAHWSAAVELAVIAALSPELDGYWLSPLRNLKERLTRPNVRRPDGLPLTVTIAQLRRSGVYGQISRLITSDMLEHWDDGDWRIVCYGALFRGEQVSAIFAVPRLRFDPGAVRATLVNDSTGKAVLSLDPVSDPLAEAGWYGSRDLVPLI